MQDTISEDGRLCGRQVHRGDKLELAVGGGAWLPVNVEQLGRTCIVVTVELAGGLQLTSELPRAASARWPVSDRLAHGPCAVPPWPRDRDRGRFDALEGRR